MTNIQKSDYKMLIAFTILAIIFTYPVCLSIISGDKFPGLGDVYWFLWDLWWHNKALTEFNSPYYTTYMFYPTGVNLAFSTLTPFNALLSVPLQLIFGLIRTYNILWILSFIISGYGTFLLVKYLTGDIKAAFISGLIFMFSPYHFAHALGHLNLITIEWIPFYILFLFKIISDDKIKNAIYAGIFLSLVFMSDYYYILYMSFFTSIFLLYYLFSDKKVILKKDILKRFLIMTAAFILIISPLVYPLIKELLTSKSNYMYIGGFETYSADILGFFIPTQFHPIFKDYVNPIYNNFTGNMAENTVFIGYTALFLALIAILKIKTKEIRFWTLSAIIALILTLGPILHINGELIRTIKLPYSLLMNIPIVSIARVPSRWDVLVMLSIAVLAGYGSSYIFQKSDKISDKRYRNSILSNKNLTIIFSCLILFEFLAIPYPMASAKVPEFYYQLKNDTDNYAILEIPITNYVPSFQSDILYYQTVHEKKLVGGYVSRMSQSTMEFIESTPILSQLNRRQYPSTKYELTDILNQNDSDIGRSVLNYYNIRYIVIHSSAVDQNYINFSNHLLRTTLNVQPKTEDDLIIYEINKSNIKQPFMLIGNGWYREEDWTNGPGRWMDGNSTIKIMSPRDINATLFFDVGSFYKNGNLHIYTNEKLVGEYIVELQGNTLKNISVPIILKKGENTVRFDSGKGVSPLDIGLSTDSRELSLGFQNITLVYLR
jgi:hypothetical protein